MAFPKLERGQEVTIKANPNIITMGYSSYYYGGADYDGIKCIVQQIERFNVQYKCFDLYVSFNNLYNIKHAYHMLECEFEEYYD